VTHTKRQQCANYISINANIQTKNTDPDKQEPINDEQYFFFANEVGKEKKWSQWFGIVTRLETTRTLELKLK
jgi:hypothetical protein